MNSSQSLFSCIDHEGVFEVIITITLLAVDAMKTMLHFAFSSCTTLGNQHMASACVTSESCSVPPSHAHKPYSQLLYFLILTWSYRTTSKIHIQHILVHARTFFHFQIGTGTRAVNLTLPLSLSIASLPFSSWRLYLIFFSSSNKFLYRGDRCSTTSSPYW